jgi:hypothetical protein
MPTRCARVTISLGIAAIVAAGSLTAQTPIPGEFPDYDPPRTADGHPDLNGIWQAMTTANWDIEAHGAASGPYPEILGAWGAQPGGLSIVQGGTIPYQPWALEKRRENYERRMELSVPGDGVDPPLGDPELKCWMPGVPRTMYMPYPFQLVQTPEFVLLAHEFNGTARIVRMNWEEESPVDDTFFMGWSRGHWDDDTLVIDVTSLNEDNRLDRAGNFYSAAVRIVERLTLVSPYHLMYEATIEDPNVYTRPWTIRFPLYRRMEQNAQVMEFKCQPYVEEMLYGQFTKPGAD